MATALLQEPDRNRYSFTVLVDVVRRHVSQTLSQPTVSNKSIHLSPKNGMHHLCDVTLSVRGVYVCVSWLTSFLHG